MPYKSKVQRRDSLPVREFYDTFKDELKLDLIAGAKGLDNIIGERSVNRPALALVGHFQFFANKRIQLFGAGEMAFFKELADQEQEKVLRDIAEREILSDHYSQVGTPASDAEDCRGISDSSNSHTLGF